MTEREVFKFVFKGLKNIVIAQQLFVSENTIKNIFKTYIKNFK
ncbi:LuxR C-terminal-related transcriptional regulator [Lysinibacillus fusiformis]